MPVPLPKLVSSVPSLFSRTRAKSLSVPLSDAPTIKILPSGCSVTSYPNSLPEPTAMVTIPVPPKLVSRLPSSL